MENIKIYVCSHKDFEWDLVSSNKIFEVLNSKNIRNKYCDIEYCFAEIYHLYDIYLNKLNESEYIGLNQYRKIFDLKNKNIVEDLKENDIILPTKIEFPCTCLQQLNGTSIKLFIDILNIVLEMHKDYQDDILAVMNNNKLYAFNMFIMSSENIKRYCEWLYPIIDKFLEKENFKTYDDLYNYVDTHKEEFNNVLCNPNPYYASVKQNTRIVGGFAERLFSIYIHHNFKNIKEYNIIESGQKQSLE